MYVCGGPHAWLCYWNEETWFISNLHTDKLVYNDTLGATKICCYNQGVVVTRAFCTETIESVPAMRVVVKRLML